MVVQPRNAVVDSYSQDVKDQTKKAYTDWSDSMFCMVRQKGHVHHGTEMSGASSLRVQVEGARIVVMADVLDVKQFLNKNHTDKSDKVTCV